MVILNEIQTTFYLHTFFVPNLVSIWALFKKKKSRNKFNAFVRSSCESTLLSLWKHPLTEDFLMQGLFLNKWIVIPTAWMGYILLEMDCTSDFI